MISLSIKTCESHSSTMTSSQVLVKHRSHLSHSLKNKKFCTHAVHCEIKLCAFDYFGNRIPKIGNLWIPGGYLYFLLLSKYINTPEYYEHNFLMFYWSHKKCGLYITVIISHFYIKNVSLHPIPHTHFV